MNRSHKNFHDSSQNTFSGNKENHLHSFHPTSLGPPQGHHADMKGPRPTRPIPRSAVVCPVERRRSRRWQGFRWRGELRWAPRDEAHWPNPPEQPLRHPSTHGDVQGGGGTHGGLAAHRCGGKHRRRCSGPQADHNRARYTTTNSTILLIERNRALL